MPGIYLKCDKCGKTLGGEVSEPPLRIQDGQRLREVAFELGWSVDPFNDKDICLQCRPEHD